MVPTTESIMLVGFFFRASPKSVTLTRLGELPIMMLLGVRSRWTTRLTSCR